MPKIVDVPGMGHVEFPDSMSDADVSAAIRKSLGVSQQPAQPEQKSASGFIGNVIGSGVNTVSGMMHAAMHPIDTVSSVANLADGAAQMIPGVAKLEQMGGTDPKVQAQQQAQARAFVDNLKQRYGSADAVLNTLYHDPVGVLADASTLVDPAAAVAKTAGALARTGIAANRAGAVARVAGDLDKANVTGALIKPQLDPAEQAAVQFAQQKGIPLDAATATGNGALQHIQKYAGSQLGANFIAKKAIAQTQDALQNTGNDLLQQASGTPHTPETAGQSVADALKGLQDSQAKQASGHYTALEAIENNPANTKTVAAAVKQQPTGLVDAQGNPVMKTVTVQKNVALPVDMTPVKQDLQPLYDKLKQDMPIAQQQASKGLTALSNLLNADDHVPASVAENALGAIKALGREDISAQNKFILNKTVDAMQPRINSTVEAAGPDALDALQQGRALTRAKYATQETAESLNTEPVKLFNQLTQAKDANINLLRDVASKTPDAMPAVGRAYLEGLMETALADAGTAKPGTALTKWNSLGDSTKEILFKDPALRKDLDNFFTLTKKVSENPNPSGTAATLSTGAGAALLFTHPTLGIPMMIGNAGLAKLLYNPKTSRLLTKALTVPVGSAADKAIYTSRLLHAAGGFAQPASNPVPH